MLHAFSGLHDAHDGRLNLVLPVFVHLVSRLLPLRLRLALCSNCKEISAMDEVRYLSNTYMYIFLGGQSPYIYTGDKFFYFSIAHVIFFSFQRSPSYTDITCTWCPFTRFYCTWRRHSSGNCPYIPNMN